MHFLFAKLIRSSLTNGSWVYELTYLCRSKVLVLSLKFPLYSSSVLIRRKTKKISSCPSPKYNSSFPLFKYPQMTLGTSKSYAWFSKFRDTRRNQKCCQETLVYFSKIKFLLLQSRISLVRCIDRIRTADLILGFKKTTFVGTGKTT